MRLGRKTGLLGVVAMVFAATTAHASVLSGSVPDGGAADLALWLRADSLALADGAAVTRWPDMRGAGRGAVAAGEAPPVYVANALNGLPGIRFDGTNRALRVDEIVRLGREHTIVVVGHARSNAESHADTFLSYCDASRCDGSNPASVELRIRKRREGRVLQIRYPGVDPSDGTSTATTAALDAPTIVAQVRANAKYLRTYAGDVATPLISVKRESGSIVTSGKALWIGGSNDAASNLTGDVFEVLIYDRALSAGELREVFDYLADKWLARKHADAAVVFQADRMPRRAAPAFGGKVHAAATAGAGEIRIVPDKPSHAPDAWYRDRGRSGWDRVDGAFEFFARFPQPRTAAARDSTLVELDGGANGLRLSMRRAGPRELAVEFCAKDDSSACAWSLAGRTQSLGLAAGRLYHIVVSIQTHASDGHVTLNLFAAPGNTSIDASFEAFKAASSLGGPIDEASDRIHHAFQSANGFSLPVAADGGWRVELFRVWRGVPPRFEAIETFPDVARANLPQPEPPYPATFDPFNPPVEARPLARGAAAIAEWTRSGNAGDSLVLTGDQLSAHVGADAGKDTRFIVFGQNAESLNLTSASIHRLRDRRAAVKLDPTLPRGAMYLMWPANDRGVGRPVAVNQTEAWWVGPNRATRGGAVSVYGRNLSHDGGTSVAYVYLKPPGRAAGQWITPVAVNPYRIEFRVPENLANGTYELWAHNGHGGRYGWSKPVALTVDAGMTWTGATFDVTADGTDDRADDAEVQAAFRAAAEAAAKSGERSTVRFPAGRFYLTAPLSVPSNVRILGAGKGKTVLAGMGEFRANTSLLGFEVTRFNEIADLTLDFATARPDRVADSFVLGGWVQDFRMHDVRVIALRDNQVLSHLIATRASFTNCEFIGTQVMIAAGHQIAFDRCGFYAARNSIVLFLRLGVHQFSITRSTAQDYNAGDDTTGAGWSHGRFVNIVSGRLGSRDVYIGENATSDLGVHPNYLDQNTGEQVSWDEATGQFVGTVLSATENTVTFRKSPPPLTPASALIAVVLDGKGEGQVRDVTEVRGTSIRLAEPWHVIPNATSTIALGAYHERAVVYRNRLDGKAAQSLRSVHTASAGIQPFGGMSNLIADGNIITDCRQGIYAFGAANGNAAQPELTFPSLFHLYTNNLIQGSRYANWLSASGANARELATYGYVFRDNTVADTIGPAGRFVVNTRAGNLDMIVFDRNVGATMPQDYVFDYAPTSAVDAGWLIWAP